MVRVIIRIQLHIKSHSTGDALKAILIKTEKLLHPEEIQPLVTINPQCIKPSDIYTSVYIYICIYLGQLRLSLRFNSSMNTS